jgi:uncharacterized protein DUF4160
MSPTLLNRREHGYDVRLFTKDHPPAHVHVFNGDNEAKVGLEPVAMLDNWGFNNREIKTILELIEENQAMLLTEWDKYHPIRSAGGEGDSSE